MKKSLFFINDDTLMLPERLCPSTWLEHIPFAFWVTPQLKPSVFVELGTYYGSSYFSFCQVVSRYGLKTRCYAIDTWQGDEQSGFYDNEIYSSVCNYNQNRYSSFSTLIKSTFEKSLSYFDNHSIDMLHIDGCHTYEAVRADFESWKPKLSENAIVLLHDINVKEREFGVCRLWDELKHEYKHFEFLHGCGLGVLAVGDTYSPGIEKLFAAQDKELIGDFIRKYFSRLGSGINYMYLYEKLTSKPKC